MVVFFFNVNELSNSPINPTIYYLKKHFNDPTQVSTYMWVRLKYKLILYM